MPTNSEGLIRRWFEEVWNEKRVEAIDELYADDAIAHGLGEGGGDVVGPEGFKQFHTTFCQAFPDMQITVEEVITDGDRAAARFSGWGTHQGDALGVPPTGNRVTFTGMTFTRWEDGKIQEGWNNVDIMGILKQVNAL
ncbi:MAG: ester cyclase [Armatimonadetes bacterium]|nr:ester cyclase [Armatimonadota bacterium]